MSSRKNRRNNATIPNAFCSAVFGNWKLPSIGKLGSYDRLPSVNEAPQRKGPSPLLAPAQSRSQGPPLSCPICAQSVPNFIVFHCVSIVSLGYDTGTLPAYLPGCFRLFTCALGRNRTCGQKIRSLHALALTPQCLGGILLGFFLSCPICAHDSIFSHHNLGQLSTDCRGDPHQAAHPNSLLE